MSRAGCAERRTLPDGVSTAGTKRSCTGFVPHTKDRMIEAMNLALVFGTLTLTCWMIGGAIAVFGNAEQCHPHRQQISEFVTLGLNILGLLCAIMMGAVLVAQ